MPPAKGRFRNYSEDAMKAAMDDVRENRTTIRAAARKFGVPRVTLKYKLEGKSPVERKMGPPPVLNPSEEQEIVEWIEKQAEVGFPVTIDELITSAQHFIQDTKRGNPFKNNRPGKSWLKGFYTRNPAISKLSQNLTATPVTADNIPNWFSNVYDYLKKTDCDAILYDPSRIFSCDEAGFFLNPRGNKVLAKRGCKPIPDEKDCVTVLLTGCASGVLAPTMVLYKYERVPDEIAVNFPQKWGLGKSDTGWMTCDAFYEYVTGVFHPWLLDTKTPLPVVLFIDGRASHLSLQTTRFCDENGIILLALCRDGGVSHPMNVVFETLKENWKKKVEEKIQNFDNPVLDKKYFPRVLEEAIDENVTENILRDGFRRCGLYPWNLTTVVVKQETEDDFSRLEYLREGFRFLNDNIESEKIDAFRCSSHVWTGDAEDTSLFLLWKKVQNELEKYEGVNHNSWM